MLPFSFMLPEHYEIAQHGKSAFIIKRNNDFHLVLTYGNYSGSHSVPPGYKILDKRSIRTPAGITPLLFAKGWIIPFLPRLIISSFITWPLIYTFLHNQVDLKGLILLGILAPLTMTIRIGTPIKCAFVYDGVEYVFTGKLKQRQEVEKVLESLEF